MASSIKFTSYESEAQMPELMALFQKDLSEPYSVYTYRYFIYNWSELCFIAYDSSSKPDHDVGAPQVDGSKECRGECIGAIVCKLERGNGYIAMLAVKNEYRRQKIGSKLVQLAIEAMKKNGANEIVLETEVTNQTALRLYGNLGFVRDKRMFKYYLSGLDALRLKLWMQ